ncbi:hypothetical protein N9A28_06650 [Sulfurimonas sp.]|nr:hypothetical protein [Sulfurimonas sp.]
MRILLVCLFFFSALFANELDKNATLLEKPLQKVLYVSYEDVPKRIINGSIFTITIKTLSTVKNFTDITYELSESQGLKLLSDYPSREIHDKYYYETFYFLATSKSVKLPNIKATLLSFDDNQYATTILAGKQVNVVSLNPKKNFANIIADSFELLEYKTTSYDTQYNIVVFSAVATTSDISAFNLQNIHKQGIESVLESYLDSKITYYAIISKKIKNFSFTYFNLKTNKFEMLNIPIIVNDDSVTTQSDLKPKDQSHQLLKIKIASAVAFILFIVIMWRKQYIYLFFVLLPLAYIAYLSVPSKAICIKEGSNIQLLPVEHGTIFETTPVVYHLLKEGKTKNYTKVKLQNERIGWVKDEDICSY